IGYPNSPFFNDGVIAQAVDDVFAQGVFYTSAAGNAGNLGWQASWQGASATVGGTSGTYFTFGGGDVLQDFTLGVNKTVTLTFQWDAAFLEGGSAQPNFQVPNNLDVYVVNRNNGQIVARFQTVNQNTDEAFELVNFTNNGSFGTNNFAFAFRLVSGPAPGVIRWINLGDDVNAQGQGNSPTIWRQPAAKGAPAAGATPAGNPTAAESFSSVGGPMSFLFDRNGNRLATPEVRNKPDITGPDGVHTTFFSQSDGAGGFVFFGTS